MLGDAGAALTAIAEKLQALVVTSREGKGAIDDRHPLSVGTMWVNRRLRPVLDAADVVLAVGTRMQGFGLQPGQQLVHIDADAEQIGRNSPVSVAVPGDAKLALEALNDVLGALPERPSRAEEGRSVRAGVLAELAGIGPQFRIVEALRQGVPEDGILVCDTATVAYACHMAYPVYAPRTYLSTSYMGTLGFGYPAALGREGRAARPARWSRSSATAASCSPRTRWRPRSSTASTPSRSSSMTVPTATPTATSRRSTAAASSAPGCATRTGRRSPGPSGSRAGGSTTSPSFRMCCAKPAPQTRLPSSPCRSPACPAPSSSVSDLEALVEQLAARLQAVEDELAITRLLTSYGFAVDGDDADACAALYSPDALVTIDDAVRLEGRDEIRTIVTSDAHQAILPGCAHVMGPFTVAVTGDTATATGYATVYVAGEAGRLVWRQSLSRWTLRRRPEGGGCSAASRGASDVGRRRTIAREGVGRTLS